MPEVFRLAHDVGRRAAQRAHDGAHPAAVDGEHAVHHAHEHDDGDEVRQVGDRLGDLAEAAAGHGVHDQRQQNRHREPGQQIVKAQDERVAHEQAEVVAAEEVAEPLHAHPFAAGDAVREVEVAEGDLHAVHRPVMEDEDIQEGGENHQVQRAVVDHPADGLLPVLPLDGRLHAVHSSLSGHSGGPSPSGTGIIPPVFRRTQHVKRRLRARCALTHTRRVFANPLFRDKRTQDMV